MNNNKNNQGNSLDILNELATKIARELGIKMRGCVLTSGDLW